MDYVDAEDEAREARDVVGHLRQALGVARVVIARPGIHALCSGRDATAGTGARFSN
jgi:hypothetical protein